MREEFDDIIKRKLEQLPIEGTPDWSVMQDRIEGEAFDSLLRDQLHSTTNLSGADKVLPAIVGWDALENKLDLENEIEGDVFDRILSQKLSSIETSVQPEASWKILSHRMDTLWPLRKVLVRYRALEIAAAIALLLTFAPHLRDNPISIRGGFSTAAGVVLESPQNGLVLDQANNGEFLAPHEIEALVYEDKGSTVQALNSASSTGNSSRTVSSVTSSKNSSPIYSPFDLLKSVFGWFDESSLTQSSLDLVDGNNHNHIEQASPLEGNTARTSFSSNGLSTDSQGSLQIFSVDLLGLSPLSLTNSVALKIPALPQKQSTWELGTNAGYHLWNINTPADAEFEQQASNRWHGSTTFGISANRKFNERFALGLGTSFSRLSYDPELPTVFDAGNLGSGFPFSRTESFDGISVTIAQIPVDLRVQLTKPGKRINLLAFAGLAGNFTLSSGFDVERTIGEPPPLIMGPPSGEIETVIENENTFSDVKEFASGIFETGGRLSGNTFLSARIGLESTFEINKRLSAFSALSYNHFIPTSNGFGPNNDQLSSLGLNVGVRVSL